MIYEEDGMVVIEYGHGSIFGFATEKDDDNAYSYGLVSADKGEIDRECEIFESVIGKPLTELNPSVVFRFFRKDSLKILIEGLQDVYDRMEVPPTTEQKADGENR